MRLAPLLPGLLAAAAGCSAPAQLPVPLVGLGQGAGVGPARAGLTCDALSASTSEDPDEQVPPVPAARCAFRSEVLVRNPGAAPIRVRVRLPARGAREVLADLDGDGVMQPAPDEDRAEEWLTLAPGEARKLRAEGRLFPAEGYWSRTFAPPLAARHPVLAWASGPRDLSFDVAPNVWDGSSERPPLALRIIRPAAWEITLKGARPRAVSPPLPAGPPAGAAVTEHEAPQRSVVTGMLHVPGRIVEPGGPVIGVGATSPAAGARSEGPWRFTAALGYELGVGEWTILSLALDTDLDRRLVIAPVVELVTPYVRPWLPPLGLGLGAPVSTLGEPTLGVRMQAAIGLPWTPFLGVTTYVDFYPALGTRTWTLLARSSL